MTRKKTSSNRPTRQGKGVSSARAPQARRERNRRAGEETTVRLEKTAANKKVVASAVAGVAAAAGLTAAARRKRGSRSAKREKSGKSADTGLRDDREIKGEVPDALALFLEVYGRL